eukprot:5724840-Alexandrium_andersonii.AAC.1
MLLGGVCSRPCPLGESARGTASVRTALPQPVCYISQLARWLDLSRGPACYAFSSSARSAVAHEAP